MPQWKIACAKTVNFSADTVTFGVVTLEQNQFYFWKTLKSAEMTGYPMFYWKAVTVFFVFFVNIVWVGYVFRLLKVFFVVLFGAKGLPAYP